MAAGSLFPVARLSDSDLLNVWEVGALQHPLDRALTVLVAAESESRRGELARLPRGHRDARLLAIYEGTFGRVVEALGRCPQCNERVEFSLDVQDLLSVYGEAAREGPFSLASDGCRVTFRLPDSRDLAEIAAVSDLDAARRKLLGRCVSQASREGKEIGLEEMPEGVIGQIVARMADLDPMAEIEVVLECPGCEARWPLSFDIESFLWRKIEDRAGRLLREVHVLASAYGWRQAEILALTAARRQAYLEMIS